MTAAKQAVSQDQVLKIRNAWKWIREPHNAGQCHMFILTGNMRDYVPYINDKTGELESYCWSTAMIQARTASRIVVKYDLSRGITFPNGDGDKRKFIKVLQEAGVVQAPQAPVRNGGSALGRVAGNAAPVPTGDEEDPLADLVAPVAAFNAFDKVMHLADGPGISLLIDYAETLIPTGEMIQQSEDRLRLQILLQEWPADQALAGRHVIFLVTKDSGMLLEQVRSHANVRLVDFPIPNYNERLAFIRQKLADRDRDMEAERAAEKEDGATKDQLAEIRDKTVYELADDQLAALTSGLNYLGIEDVLLVAWQKGKLTEAMVKERKNEIIVAASNGRLDPTKGRFTLDDIAVEEEVKRYLRKVIRNLKARKIDRVPRGILFTGPPGTGKTTIAMGVAAEAGMNYVSWDPGKLLGKFVGESEANMRADLTVIKAMGPCIVFVDEIDTKGMSRSSGGDSGVSSRLLSSMLTFMSDPEIVGSVLFIFATNRPDNIDSALMRPGRVDKSVPILPPGVEQRVKVLAYVLGKARNFGFEVADLQWLADRTEGYTGAFLEAIATKAVEYADDDDRDSILRADVERAFEAVFITNAQANLRMTTLALEFANDLDLVPAEYRDQYRNKKGAQKPPTPDEVGDDWDSAVDQATQTQFDRARNVRKRDKKDEL